MDVQNVVAPPKEKTSVRKATTSTEKDLGASPSNAEVKAEKVPSPIKSKDIADHQHENGSLRSPESPGRTTKENQSNEFQDSPFKESGADNSPHAKGSQRYVLIYDFHCVPLWKSSVNKSQKGVWSWHDS